MLLKLNFVYRNPSLGVKLLKAFFCMFTILSLYIHIKHDFTLQMDVMENLMSTVYMVPWTRSGPYFIGTMVAILIQSNGGKLEISDVSKK